MELDDLIDGSIYFRWREALWCPRWGVYVFPTPEQKQNIIKTAKVMDAIRNRLGKPIVVTSWLRPNKYNEWSFPYGVGGAKNSAHCEGKACDFQVVTMNCDEVRLLLLPLLPHLGIRMERLDGSNWVHIDIRNPGPEGNRYFYPGGSLG